MGGLWPSLQCRILKLYQYPKLNMKMILLFTCAITLFTTTGCMYPGRGGGDWHRRGDADTAPPVAAATTTNTVAAPHPAVLGTTAVIGQ
jgi:hypothetical protein